MLDQIKVPNQRPDEKILMALKPHWIHILNVFFMMLGLYIVPLVLFFLLSKTSEGLFSSAPAYALMIMLITIYFLSANLITFNAYLDRELDVWIVTNYRIIAIEQKGMFSRNFAEHLIERIQDVSAHRKGILQTLLNYGDVEIQTAGEQERFIFNDVKKPEEIAKLINNLLSHKIQLPDSQNPKNQDPKNI